MVYGGKPSGGCHLCRKRKVKCDQREDGCGNCARIKQTCPGYRNQMDLVFRYENECVAQRSAKAQAKRNAAIRRLDQEEGTSTPGPITTATEPVTHSNYASARLDSYELSELLAANHDSSSPSMPNYHLLPTIDDLALGFFFANLVVDITKRGDFFASGVNETLLSAIKPVGLVGVSRAAGDLNLTSAAQRMYVNAIASTNHALSSPAATEDSTLLAVMLLGIFETMTGCTSRSMISWRDHINGAAALLKLRGSEQLKTLDGIRLFMHAATNLVTDCLREALPIPKYILDTAAELRKEFDRADPGWRFFETLILTTDFLTSVWRGELKDPTAIVRRALDLDLICLSMFSEATIEWAYETVYTDQKDEFLPKGFHIYGSYVSVQGWNGMRVMRIMLHELICTVLSRIRAASILLNPEQAFQTRLSTSILHDLHSEILSTVPQHLGQVSMGSTSLPLEYDKPSPTPTMSPLFLWSHFPEPLHDYSHGANLRSSRLPILRTFGGYTLPWGLYLVGKSEIAAPAVRLYVSKLLRNLGEHMGILQAVYLADSIQEADGK